MTSENSSSGTMRYQQTLRRLAMTDEGFVQDEAGLQLGLAGTSTLYPKTAALVQLAASVANGSSERSLEWSTGVALAAGATEEEITDVLVAIAPVAGPGRAAAAAREIAGVLGYDIEGAPEDLDDH